MSVDSRWRTPEAALLGPRVWCARLARFRGRLGLPAPDPHWQHTAQVNWRGDNGVVPGFLTRLVCLYFGHDMRERKVRDAVVFPEPGWGRDTHRRDCVRCGWAGPWVGMPTADSVLDVERELADVCPRCGGSGWDRAPFGAAGNCGPCNGTGRIYPLHNRTEAA